MTAPSPRRIRELFDAAMALPGPGRDGFLQAECGEDSALHSAVARLLAASRASAGFLASATLSHQGEALSEAGSLQAGDHIGPYEITGELGRGGGGVVYLARQRQPVDREVALKMLPATADSRQAADRFRSEQRTLARMEHDHIARLHDAGVDPRGRLWFAMELVRGETVTTFCDRRCLPLPERLSLFASICRAVHHAHLRGVIHRDLKPSNILVTESGGRPVPKVIDFGIARALENPDDAAITLAGGLLGTPAYMSPEQLGDGAGEIDARTDIYSLGLVLFELLSGGKARNLPASGSAAWQAARMVLEETSPSAAAAFSALPAMAQTAAATARHTAPAALFHFLKGDAGRILTRCLEREPARRFPSAESLAADVENLLDHRPLSFRRPGWHYTMGKFLRRHRTGAAVSACALLITAAGLTVGLRAHFARIKAESRAAAESRRAAQETARAAREGRKGYLITMAMTGLFRGATPGYDNGQGPERSVRSVVEAWTRQLPASVLEDPEVEGLARLSLGHAWTGFGDLVQARAQFDQAIVLLANPSTAFAPARALTELNLAALDFQEHRFSSVEEHIQLARKFFTAGGGVHTGDLLRAELLLAGQRTGLGQTAAAREIASRVLEEVKAHLPDDFELQARAHWQLARAARAAGDLSGWERHLRQRLELIRQLNDAVPTLLLEARFDVLQADFLANRNRPGTLAAMDRIVTDYAALTSPGFPSVVAFRADIAGLLVTAGQEAEARARYEGLLREFPDSASAEEWRQALESSE
ncbi:MAG: protein kinase [Verrucomicrobiota bacterium]